MGSSSENGTIHGHELESPSETKEIEDSGLIVLEKGDGLSPEPAPGRNSRLARSVRWLPFLSESKPSPPSKGSLDDAALIPEATASFLGLLTFQWITPLLALGYARPLEATDLWKLQDDRSSQYIADKIQDSFEARRKQAKEYNARLESGEIKAGWRAVWWTLKGNRAEREKQWRERDGQRKASLVWAMNDSVKWWFWTGGVLKVVGDTALVVSPLVVKAIINFASESYEHHITGTGTLPPIGRGIGLAFALLILQVTASLCTNHFFYRSGSTGVLLRAGLITAIYSRSMRLSGRARAVLSNGKLVNHISTDVSRIDFCSGFFHMAWTAPIQMIICLILLLINLGPSALAGFAIFVIATPAQTFVMKNMFRLRQKSMVWTDKRARLLQELLGGMKILKFFNWEKPFLDRIYGYRQKEMSYVRSLLLIRAANNGVAMSMPALASVLAFVTYSLSGHSLQAADIFASLSLFQLLRMPLMFMPIAFSAIADASNATSRLYGVFEAELVTETLVQDPSLDVAIRAQDASFTWDSPPPEPEDKKKRGKPAFAGGGRFRPPQSKKQDKKEEPEVQREPEKVFHMDGVNLDIPRGKLVAIVGKIGSGKSSLLAGLIGDMRRTSGSVTFGGSVSYCAQSAWIQNASIRENICFGRPFDEEKYWNAVKSACLEPDLEMFPHGDMTEVGERGISLSGGQKQRVNICRAIYCDTDIQIFDDPLSALDAHVGKAVFQNVLLNSPAGKTRVLVTHALHFLPQVDYIITVADGRIAERGTYAELVAQEGGAFAAFVREFASKDEAEKEEEEGEGLEEVQEETEKRRKFGRGAGMMQVEERSTGAISWKVYAAYLKAARGIIILPLLAVALVLMQGTAVMSAYWLVYWEERKWNKPSGFYMAIYAALGVGQAFTFFFMGSMFALLTYFASQRLHKIAIERVMHAPMSFFDTTPLGRIMNRFSKDIDTIDNTLGDSMRMLVATFGNILGAIILIAILLHWFLIPMAFIVGCFAWAAIFYRKSARELKRLDALLRSNLYTHFSESLSGLMTIRAYGETERFRVENRWRLDTENRAYWLTVVNQRWLGIRLDFLGIFLSFIVAILTVAARYTLSPAQTGVALSYILAVQQGFGWMVRQFAEVENDMNSVERVVYYANEIEQEPAHEIAERKPPASWPADGRIEFKNVVLKYRPGLPPVLKGLTMSVKGGEKIGIVGRTGAGKSSLMTCLARLVPDLDSGSIEIDGIDISTIGIGDLRRALSIIPQDPLLFSGTLRTNLDPFGANDDARLWDALKRAYLVEDADADDGVAESPTRTSLGSAVFESAGGKKDRPVGGAHRLTLDSPIEDEGANLSVGQRSLVSLARALVKNSKVLILDEATASVDYETDHKIQATIANEFADRTILCIAHRLRTIISYDRICVLDAGQIAEFDTPTNLYRNPDGIFRGMCERSSISGEDVRLAAKAKLA